MVSPFALLSSLCVSLKKRLPNSTSQSKRKENFDIKESPPHEGKTKLEEDTKRPPPPPAVVVYESEGTKEEAKPSALPLPRGNGHLRGSFSYHLGSKSSASYGKLLSSMSMRVQGVGMGLKQKSKRDEKCDKTLKHEDSIWKKTIILGEKCRVPDEDDTILYDEKGNRFSTYHPKTPRSLPVSRQTSFIDSDAIPSSMVVGAK